MFAAPDHLLTGQPLNIRLDYLRRPDILVAGGCFSTDTLYQATRVPYTPDLNMRPYFIADDSSRVYRHIFLCQINVPNEFQKQILFNKLVSSLKLSYEALII